MIKKHAPTNITIPIPKYFSLLNLNAQESPWWTLPRIMPQGKISFYVTNIEVGAGGQASSVRFCTVVCSKSADQFASFAPYQ
jgi:hypothetical protein